MLGDYKVKVQIDGIKINKRVFDILISHYNVPHLYYEKILLYVVNDKGRNSPIYTYVNNTDSSFELVIDREKNIYIESNFERKKVYIAQKPQYYDYVFNNKKGYEIANIEADGHLAVTLNHFCMHFHEEKQCKFCSIKSWTDNKNNSINEMLDVIKIAYDSNLISHISLTTGTINKKDKGIRGMLSFIERLREKGINTDIACEFEPVEDLNWLNELHNYNVKTVSCNIEVVEEDLRKSLMPGKGSLSKELYYKNWIKAVELFGKNQVYTNIILSKYNKDILEINRNIEIISSLGVISSIGLIYPERNTELYGMEMPSEYIVKEVNYNNTECIIKNKLNPLKVLAGCPRNGAYSPVKEYYEDYLNIGGKDEV